MGCPAARHGGRREVVDSVFRRRRTGVSDDRRVLVKRAEVQSATAELADIDVIGILSHPRPSGIALGSGFLDIVRYPAATLPRQSRGGIHRVMGHLLGD